MCRKLRLPETFNFSHLAHLTPGFVGADLMALCREAAMCAVNRVLMKQQEQRSPEMEGLPPKGAQERRGADPTSETQVLFSALSVSFSLSLWYLFVDIFIYV